jgi:hypothetical protein
MPSRRAVLKAGGSKAAGGITGASLVSTPADAASAGGQGGASVDTTLATTERPDTIMKPFRKGGPGPLYWSTYGYSNATNVQIIRHQAEVGGFSSTARSENTFGGYSGMGYVTGLDTTGSSLTLASAASRLESHDGTFKVAKGTGMPASLTVTAHDPESG